MAQTIRLKEDISMRIGVVVAQNFWLHFQGIHKLLQPRHTVSELRIPAWPIQLMSDRGNRFLVNRSLRKFLRHNDLVFFEWGEEYFIRATHLPKVAASVVRIHSHELWDFAPRANWENVDQIILVSLAMERKLLERYPGLRGRTSVVHNGVNLDKFTPQLHPFSGTIGTLSRIEPNKRIDGLIIAFHQLLQKGYDLTLRIGGACTEPRYQRYADEVALLVKRLGIEDKVSFDGQVTDAAGWLREIDIFVTNSCSEGLQVALLEAMASGCYCLSHAWDGAEEALPASQIYIAERELIEKIEAYIALDINAQIRLQENMRQIAESKFDIEQRARDVVEIIETFLEGKTT